METTLTDVYSFKTKSPDTTSLTGTDADSGYDDPGVITVPVIRTVIRSTPGGQKVSTTSTKWIAIRTGAGLEPRPLKDPVDSSDSAVEVNDPQTDASDHESASHQRRSRKRTRADKSTQCATESANRRSNLRPSFLPRSIKNAVKSPHYSADKSAQQSDLFMTEKGADKCSTVTYNKETFSTKRYQLPPFCAELPNCAYPVNRTVETSTSSATSETTQTRVRRGQRSKSADSRSIFSDTYSKVLSEEELRARDVWRVPLMREGILKEEFYKVPYWACNQDVVNGRMRWRLSRSLPRLGCPKKKKVSFSDDNSVTLFDDDNFSDEEEAVDTYDDDHCFRSSPDTARHGSPFNVNQNSKENIYTHDINSATAKSLNCHFDSSIGLHQVEERSVLNNSSREPCEHNPTKEGEMVANILTSSKNMQLPISKTIQKHVDKENKFFEAAVASCYKKEQQYNQIHKDSTPHDGLAYIGNTPNVVPANVKQVSTNCDIKLHPSSTFPTKEQGMNYKTVYINSRNTNSDENKKNSRDINTNSGFLNTKNNNLLNPGVPHENIKPPFSKPLTENDIVRAELVKILMRNNTSVADYEIYFSTRNIRRPRNTVVQRIRVPLSSLQTEWDWAKKFLEIYQTKPNIQSSADNGYRTKVSDIKCISDNLLHVRMCNKGLNKTRISSAASDEWCGESRRSSSSGCFSEPHSPTPAFRIQVPTQL